jgi:beta-glucosidase
MTRVERLIGDMQLPEKLGQLTMTAAPYAVTGPYVATDLNADIRSGAVGNLLNLYGPDVVLQTQKLAVEETRLGIPLLIGLDVIHGHRIQFPVPLAETSAFDPDLWRRTAGSAAREALADGVALTFAPMCDVCRDPRWGRIVEGPGEDAFVGAALAHAKVRGFQDAGLAACAKHFAGYGAVTAGREYASTDVSERTMHEVHLPSFAAAVEQGVLTLMPAFTEWNGVPMTAHDALLNGWLRREQGFEGMVISDYNAIGELIALGVAADLAEAAALALKAGVDIDMMANAYNRGLPVALERGLVKMAEIDDAVRRVLRLKEKLGLFDDPYRHLNAEPDTALAERRALAREAAAKSVVLLKNDRDLLPLKNVRRLAVIGPLADAGAEMRGPWAAASKEEGHVSLLQGLKVALPDVEICFAPGTPIESPDAHGIAHAAALCDGADAVLLCVGESAAMSGEAASRAFIRLPGMQEMLCEAVFARGQPVITILFSGRPLAVPRLAEKSHALLAAWFPGSEAGHGLADILTGKISPSARTPVSWPGTEGQIPVFYGERNGGRPFAAEMHYTSKYRDVPNQPIFAFGHGLTYGRFVYSGLSLSASALKEKESLKIRALLRNDGAAAEETVFLFAHDKVASVTRPLLELKGFQKIALASGASGTVEFQLPASAFKFPGHDLKPVFEAGDVEILIGPSADRAGLLSATVTLA